MPVPHPRLPHSLLKVAKYASVSVIATTTSLVILGVMVGVFDLPSVWSNIVATSIGTVPSFELNRRWVWSQRGSTLLLRQVVPFCLLSLSGLVLSSLAVHLASKWTATSSHLVHTVSVEVANIGTFGVLWVAQYVLCNKVLFVHRADDAAPRTTHSTPANAPACTSASNSLTGSALR